MTTPALAHDTAQARIAELEAEVARLKVDVERLDWLLTNLPRFHSILFDGATPLMYRGRYLKLPNELRAAIDSAKAT